ncbi:MAG TPA: hypothetical protein VJG13_03815 [Thermoanaerobaculia bacterium]|nr:hypothetical protein [Thermoanaerobaculia bacterium]
MADPELRLSFFAGTMRRTDRAFSAFLLLGLLASESQASATTFGEPYLLQDLTPYYDPDSPLWGFREVNGHLLYLANRSREGFELWRTDTTPEGTERISATGTGFRFLWSPLEGSVHPFALLYDTNGLNGLPSLWRTDGTSAGTDEIAPDVVYGAFPHFLGDSGLAVFVASSWSPGGDRDWEIWVSDGSRDGTHRLVDLWSAGPGVRSDLTRLGEEVLFIAVDDLGPGGLASGLWKSNGTISGTRLVARPPAGSFEPYLWRVQGSVFAVVDDRFGEGEVLWRTDGTPGGTSAIRAFGREDGIHTAIWPVAKTSTGRTLVNIHTLDTPSSLWSTDGTSLGTFKLVDLGVSGGGAPLYAFPVNHREWSYFFADTGGGRTLWRTDGTSSNTSPAPDLCPGDCGEQVYSFGFLDGQEYLLLHLDDGTHGIEPWISDGMPEGTRLLVDFCPGTCDSLVLTSLKVGDRFLLAVQARSFDTSGSDNQIWQTDLTPEGTSQITHFANGITYPSLSGPYEGTVLFLARDADFLADLWALPFGLGSPIEAPLSPLAGLALALLLAGAAWALLGRPA